MISKRKHLLRGGLAACAALMIGTEAIAAGVCIRTPSGTCKIYTITQTTGGVDAIIEPEEDPDPAITQFGLEVMAPPPDDDDDDEEDDALVAALPAATMSSSPSQQPRGILTCADPSDENGITLVLVPQNKILKPFSGMADVNEDGSATVKSSALDPSDPNYLKNHSLLQSLCPFQNSNSYPSISTSSSQSGERKKHKKKKLRTIPKDYVPCGTTTLVKAEDSDNNLIGSASLACSLPASQCTGNSEDPALTYDENGSIGQEYGWEWEDEDSISPLAYNCQEIPED